MSNRDNIIITVSRAGRQPLTLLLRDELVIGRECEGLVVPDSEVSRRHLRLRRRGKAVEVTDLDSTNGTRLNGVTLTGTELLDGGGQLTIGETNLTIEIKESAERRPIAELGVDTVAVEDELRRTSIDVVADAMSTQPLDPLATQQRTGDTITIVFSDIESSTERAAALGDTAWYDLLEAHNRLFRSTLPRWGGDEIKSLGDGFMMVFPSAAKALGFAASVQRAIERDKLDLRVRMGAHTGEAIADASGDLFGRHVILAARVANMAAGGQILASLVTREIAEGQEQFRFAAPTLAALKGFADAQPVYELLWKTPDRGGYWAP
ncbi:MAG: adenylate/guanylate cyclase domain-containing protein [Actinomycetota bacterium]